MAKLPNVLIFMTDQQQGATLDPDHPCVLANLERFAAEGVRFSRAYTPCGLCAPARASMMTGRYPSDHGMYNNYHSVPVMHSDLFPGIRMFSENLVEAGYRLAYVGKWHVSGDRGPADVGWEDVDVMARLREARQRLGGPELKDVHHVEMPRGWHRPVLDAIYEGALETHPDVQRTLVGIETLRRLADSGQPWCLVISLVAPHDPYISPPQYPEHYDPEELPDPINLDDDLSDKPNVYRRQRETLWRNFTRRDYARVRSRYFGMCTMLDDLFGWVLNALDETGQAQDTLVIYTSDHGDMMGGHGLFYKGVVPFEECYRIPLVVRWPAGIGRPGAVVNDYVTLNDIAPTILEACQAPPLEGIAGRSFLPLLRGQRPDDWPTEVFMQFLGTEYYYTQRIICDGRFKYVFNGFDFDELYDLQEDPGETVNLARDPQYRDEIERLCERMWHWCHRANDIMHCGYPPVAFTPVGPGVTGLQFTRNPKVARPEL